MNIIYAKTTLLYRSEPTEDVTYCIWADMLFWVCLPNFKCWPTSHCFTLGSTGTLSLVEALLESTLLSSPHYSTHSYGHPEWLWLSAGGPTGCLIIGTELGDHRVTMHTTRGLRANVDVVTKRLQVQNGTKEGMVPTEMRKGQCEGL